MTSNIVNEQFVTEEDEAKRKSFYDPLPKSNVKTMSDMNKTVKIRAKNFSLSGEATYLRLLAVNSTKRLPQQRVLLFENATVPLSLLVNDGTPLPCVKSYFMHKPEDLLPGEKITSIAEADAIISQGHAVIQMIGSWGKWSRAGDIQRYGRQRPQALSSQM